MAESDQDLVNAASDYALSCDQVAIQVKIALAAKDQLRDAQQQQEADRKRLGQFMGSDVPTRLIALKDGRSVLLRRYDSGLPEVQVFDRNGNPVRG